jgi:Phage integrase, N-terminal SAM-like domain
MAARGQAGYELNQGYVSLRPAPFSAYTRPRSYVDWVRWCILFHDKRHPMDLGAAGVSAFLSYLASQRNASASTQNQAKAALLFLYQSVLAVDPLRGPCARRAGFELCQAFR